MAATHTTPAPGPTDPLPRKWHRVTWKYWGQPQYMVTDQITAAVLARVALEAQAGAPGSKVTDVAMQSWSDYPQG